MILNYRTRYYVYLRQKKGSKWKPGYYELNSLQHNIETVALLPINNNFTTYPAGRCLFIRQMWL